MEGFGVHYRWCPLSGIKYVEESTSTSVVRRRREAPNCDADTGSGRIGFAVGAALRRERDKTRVADDIRRQNSRESPLHCPPNVGIATGDTMLLHDVKNA